MHVQSLLHVTNNYVCLFTHTPTRLRAAKGKDSILLILNALQHPAHCPEQQFYKGLLNYFDLRNVPPFPRAYHRLGGKVTKWEKRL